MVGEIYRELDTTLRSNRQLAQQMRDAFRSGGLDAEHQRALVSLVTGRARQALPGVAKRVLNEWTSTVVAANQDRRTRQRAAEHRVDIAGSGGTGSDGPRSMTPRDIDYKPHVRRRHPESVVSPAAGFASCDTYEHGNYWLLFAATQLCGTVVPYFGNVHMNILPIVIGVALLFPGVLVENISSINHLPTAVLFTLVILLNAVVWHLIRKILHSRLGRELTSRRPLAIGRKGHRSAGLGITSHGLRITNRKTLRPVGACICARAPHLTISFFPSKPCTRE